MVTEGNKELLPGHFLLLSKGMRVIGDRGVVRHCWKSLTTLTKIGQEVDLE